MKAVYISPRLSKLVLQNDVIATSTPDNIHNQYKPGEGLAPGRKSIWN